MEEDAEIKEVQGPYHDFWLQREGETDYGDYRPLSGRRDAPVRIAMYVMDYLSETMKWFPTVNPALSHAVRRDRTDFGLNFYGPTVINKTGWALFGRICESWAQLFACGPERIILTDGVLTELDEDGRETETKVNRFWVSRDRLVEDLQTLADFGKQAATGDYFIWHLGI